MLSAPESLILNWFLVDCLPMEWQAKCSQPLCTFYPLFESVSLDLMHSLRAIDTPASYFREQFYLPPIRPPPFSFSQWRVASWQKSEDFHGIDFNQSCCHHLTSSLFSFSSPSREVSHLRLEKLLFLGHSFALGEFTLSPLLITNTADIRLTPCNRQ